MAVNILKALAEGRTLAVVNIALCIVILGYENSRNQTKLQSEEGSKVITRQSQREKKKKRCKMRWREPKKKNDGGKDLWGWEENQEKHLESLGIFSLLS